MQNMSQFYNRCFIIVYAITALFAMSCSGEEGVDIIGQKLADDIYMVEDDFIFDFTSANFTQVDIAAWTESSDTVREPGMSKASIVLQKSRLFQRMIFFAMLNPQPNGACFAGSNVDISLGHLVNKDGIQIRCRSQGQLSHWKVVLKYTEDNRVNSLISYEQLFEMNLESEELEDIFLPFHQFKAYFRGDLIVDAPALDVQQVGRIGLQAYGGVYEDYKQSGTGSLEVDFIKAY